MQRQIQLESIIEAGLESLKGSIYVCMPGAVVAYHAATQTADVQPMIQDVRFNIETDAVVYEPWPVMLQVPVAWPRFGSFVIAGPLQPNDQVVLHAFDLDPTAWRTQGRSQAPVKPADVRRLGGVYWHAVPTDLTGPMKSASPMGAAFVIGVDGDQAQILYKSGSIQLGATGGDFVALASKVDNCMAAIKTHVHPGTSLLANVSTGAITGSTLASTTLSSLPATGSTLIAAQ